MSLRIVFMGTPDFSVPTLQKLHEDGHEIVAVYSQPPRPAGRGMEPRKTPVHAKADELGIPAFTPISLKSEEEQSRFSAHECDVAVVVAYGLLLPQAILRAPKFGCYNGHASLLPRWRGAAPIQRAIMAGDSETGVMIMKMEAGLDTGPVAMTATVPITPNMTAGQLHDELMVAGADQMSEAMVALEQNTLSLTAQAEEGVTYARKIEKAEARIDWNQPVQSVHDHIRGLSPFPGAWCEIEIKGKPVRVKVLETAIAGASSGKYEPGTISTEGGLAISCNNGWLRINRLQRAGKQAMSAEEFLRGHSPETISAVV